jgi:DNA-binding response OmpR family regulator
MTRSWSLLQAVARSPDRASERDTVQESVSSTGMIESGDFRINLDERTVALRGQELRLTSEEFDVLVFLVGHRQSLVTPDTLLATTWTANQVRRTEFLRALLSLRKKLDASGPDQHYLRTEPWIIYRFDPASSSVT